MSDLPEPLHPFSCMECGHRFEKGEPVRLSYYGRFVVSVCESCYEFRLDVRDARMSFKASVAP